MTSPSPDTEFDTLAGAVIVGGYDGLDLPRVIAERLRKGWLAGVIVFKRNLHGVHSARALCSAVLAASPAGEPCLISIDQEGGRVARLGPPVLSLPPMRVLGTHGDPRLAERVGHCLGVELASVGFNLDFAPVCDVDSNPANPVIGDRSFSPDPALAGAMAAAFGKGLQSAGVAACAKHFPGHGDTSTDSHHELPVLPHDRERLEAVELPPFRAAFAAGVASVMTAHVRFDALDSTVPATLSPAVITGLLRDTLLRERPDAVIVSDDLLMKAVRGRWTVGESAVLAIAAGCDMVLVCSDPDAHEEARVALAERARADAGFAARLSEARGRVSAMRRKYPPRPASDDAELDRVLARPEHELITEALRRCAE